MASAAAVEWFIRACGSSPPRAPARDPPAAKMARDKGCFDLPFDVAVVICMEAWRSDARAPRLAAVNITFRLANSQAALNLRGVDVKVARSNVTEPDGDSIDPEDGAQIATFTEELASWGVRIEHYTNINVIAPHAIKEVHVNAAGAPRRGIIRHARTGRGTVRGLTAQHTSTHRISRGEYTSAQ